MPTDWEAQTNQPPTNTKDAEQTIQVSGKHCLERVDTHVFNDAVMQHKTSLGWVGALLQ